MAAAGSDTSGEAKLLITDGRPPLRASETVSGVLTDARQAGSGGLSPAHSLRQILAKLSGDYTRLPRPVDEQSRPPAIVARLGKDRHQLVLCQPSETVLTDQGSAARWVGSACGSSNQRTQP